jgi:hypothetical protein
LFEKVETDLSQELIVTLNPNTLFTMSILKDPIDFDLRLCPVDDIVPKECLGAEEARWFESADRDFLTPMWLKYNEHYLDFFREADDYTLQVFGMDIADKSLFS